MALAISPRLLRAAACAALVAASPAGAQIDLSASPIGPPPATLALDGFYQRHVDAAGIPIASSAAVPDAALLAARDIAVAMLLERPDLRRAMVAGGFRVAIMGVDEGTVDLPEQRDWKKPAPDDPRLTRCERKHYQVRIGNLTDRDYWNQRARGMGGPLTSAATENLLGIPGTRYYGENIFVHEFSHGILNAITTTDPALHARVQRAYDAAKRRGLWKGEYAETTIDEYWAEGTQTWFNSNKLAVIDGQRVLNDEDLATYDVALYNVLSEVYGDRHRLPGDVFHRHPARAPAPAGPLPKSTAEIC